MDALLYTTPRRLANLRTRFDRAGFETELRRGEADDPIPAMLILRDRYNNQVDLLGGLPAWILRPSPEPWRFPSWVSTFYIIGREDFIAMKRFAGGPQDLPDAQSAYRSAQGPVDLDLLRAVTRRFGRDAADKLEQVLAN